MRTLRLIGIVSLAACLAGGLSGQDPADAAAGTEFEQAVTILKTFHRESKSGFANLQGEPLKTYGGKLWRSKVGYPPAVNSLTRIYAPDGRYSRKYLSVKIGEPSRESALLRLKLLSEAIKEVLPEWTVSEPPQTADDLQFNEDNGTQPVRRLQYEAARASPKLKANLEVTEDLEKHTFTTYLSIQEDLTP